MCLKSNILIGFLVFVLCTYVVRIPLIKIHFIRMIFLAAVFECLIDTEILTKYVYL